MNGHLVGYWTVTAGDSAFVYEENWLSSPHRRPISLSMPLRASSAPYRGEVVANFLEGFLKASKSIEAQ